MDKRVEQLEKEVQSLSGGQQTIINQLKEFFSQLNTRIDQISRQEGESFGAKTRLSGAHGSSSGDGSHSTYTPKLVKLIFPRFNGQEDPTIWICQVEQFFQFHDTPSTNEVSLILSFRRRRPIMQQGSVEEYQTKFEKLLSKTGHLAHERQVSCFISGLKDNIKTEVQAGRPSTLSSAIRLAKLYEARNKAHYLVLSKVSSTNYEAQSSPENNANQ
ncbi:hypothetical protein Patl1_28900 [Pistacia atlantica]|uniref:Uncharacterized protein n=1 Tax=Pistacia atlantica TaxID=434234 RepID=A0ACC1BBM1_9ROSI|nr:hypothetical protein Patl1_28900 [Pistacia atlantica]